MSEKCDSLCRECLICEGERLCCAHNPNSYQHGCVTWQRGDRPKRNLKSRSQMRRAAAQKPDALIQEIESLRAELEAARKEDAYKQIQLDSQGAALGAMGKREASLREVLENLEAIISYCLGPTRDVKTPKLQNALRITRAALGEKGGE